MGRTKIVKMRFDMDNKYDVATYQRLGESARRADRRGRGNQANYLISLMLGVRIYGGMREAGLTERPQFPPEIDELWENIMARIKEVHDQMAGTLVPEQNRAPDLRLVPASDHSVPELIA